MGRLKSIFLGCMGWANSLLKVVVSASPIVVMPGPRHWSPVLVGNRPSETWWATLVVSRHGDEASGSVTADTGQERALGGLLSKGAVTCWAPVCASPAVHLRSTGGDPLPLSTFPISPHALSLASPVLSLRAPGSSGQSMQVLEPCRPEMLPWVRNQPQRNGNAPGREPSFWSINSFLFWSVWKGRGAHMKAFSFSHKRKITVSCGPSDR